jgi:3-oxoadipate enol-lactonase
VTTLNIRVDGTGPPVTLVHSGVCDLHAWDEVAADLAADRTVVRYDLRGFGASPPPTEGFRHVDDLDAVLDAAGVGRTALVGNSFGGLLALAYTVAHPERVTHLALLAPPIDNWTWSATVAGYQEAEGKALDAGDLDGAVALNQDMWVRGPVREWTPALRALGAAAEPAMRIALSQQTLTEGHEFDDDEPVRARLDRVRIPTLVAVGDADAEDFPAIARVLAGEIAGARHLELPGAGHLLPLERPREVIVAVRELLEA